MLPRRAFGGVAAAGVAAVELAGVAAVELAGARPRESRPWFATRPDPDPDRVRIRQLNATPRRV